MIKSINQSSSFVSFHQNTHQGNRPSFISSIGRPPVHSSDQMRERSNLEACVRAPSRPRTNFLSLSRELRDHCYSLALTTSTPLVAWCGIRPGNSETEKALYTLADDVMTAALYNNHTSDLRNLATSLLRCNSIIASEAAPIFYGKNKFLFAGDWTWEKVVNWFEDIGPRNRALVSSIEMKVYEPSHAWQKPDGERVEVPEALEPPFPRSRHLYRSPESLAEGIVETINPAVETFFKLLSNDNVPTAPKLLIRMSLQMGLLPGFHTDIDDLHPYEGYFSMDLPNVIEKLRGIYTGDNGRSIEVTWQGRVTREGFLEERTNINKPWEILNEWEEDEVLPSRPNRRKRPTLHFMWFTLKRRAITEPLLAAEPSPHSWHGR